MPVNPVVDNGYSKRKAERVARFNKTAGIKQVTCGACSGSGYYDHFIRGRTPKCGNCNGTGKEFPTTASN